MMSIISWLLVLGSRGEVTCVFEPPHLHVHFAILSGLPVFIPNPVRAVPVLSYVAFLRLLLLMDLHYLEYLLGSAMV